MQIYDVLLGGMTFAAVAVMIKLPAVRANACRRTPRQRARILVHSALLAERFGEWLCSIVASAASAR